MQENKNLVEAAFIQMKNVEEAIAENAKGILASTMKEEINQLVKESLSEQDDEEDINLDVDMEDSDLDDSDLEDEMDTDNEDEIEMDLDMDMDSEETPIDLTGESDETILKVFKAMGEKDGIIVKKDGEDIHLTDTNSDSEYLVKLGESYEDETIMDEMNYMETDESVDDVINAIFSKDGNTSNVETEQVVYEIHLDDEELDEQDEELDEQDEELDEYFYFNDEDEDEDEMETDNEYEIEMDESDLEDEMDTDNVDESYSPKKTKRGINPKGVGIGKGPKFTYKKSSGGFKEDKKEGPKSVGTGKAKFEFKKGENMEGKSKVVKKVETKEAARTLGMGSNFRKGGLPKPRAHSKVNNSIKESLETEVSMLREKNDEYRKALNVFREKLNEVAIFNSNLAYATRLFTEHSTTKKEKINILRRFDGVETIKESKNLYKSVKEELTKSGTKPMNESVETKLNKTVSTGSSSILIESKTYENPQFLRMKDLMSKLG